MKGGAMRAKTREDWLERMTAALLPKFKAAGYPLPAKVRVSCGWPSHGGTGRRQQVEGQCWPAEASENGTPEVFISPVLADPLRVAGVLVHELIHALPIHGHASEFKRPAVALGLFFNVTATTESKALKEELAALIKTIGKYPHGKIKVSHSLVKKQTTRLLKAECPSCGYTVRVTAKWVAVGLPTCPCGGAMAAA